MSCNGVGLEPFIIPAGTTGTPSKTYDGLLAGSTVPAAISDEYTVGATTTTTIEDTTIPDTVEAETLPPTGTGSGTVPGAPIAALLLVAGGVVVLRVRRRASG